MREDSTKYLLLAEGFNAVNNSLKKSAFQGLREYIEGIKEFKYKRAYEMLKKIIEAWKHRTDVRKIKKKESILLQRKQELTILYKSVKGWSNYMKRLKMVGRVKNVIEDEHKNFLKRKAFGMWRNSYEEHLWLHMNAKRAMAQWESFSKLKAMKGWILYVNGKYLKQEYYGKYRQVCYKKLLSKSLRRWKSILANKKKLQSNSNEFAKSIYAKEYFKKWKENYLSNAQAKYMYGQLLKRRIISLLKKNKLHNNHKALACQRYEFNKKKTVLTVLFKRKVRRKLVKCMKARKELVKLGKALKQMRDYSEERQTRRAHKVASIQHCRQLYAKKAMKAFEENKMRNAKLRNSVIVFAVNKLRKVFVHFNAQIAVEKKRKSIYSKIAISHFLISKRLLLSTWHNAQVKLNAEASRANAHHAKMMKRKLIKGLRKGVEKHKKKLHMVEVANSKSKSTVLKKAFKSMKKHITDPMLLKQKRAIKLYLKTIYKKSIRKLLIHSSQEKIRRNVRSYCIIRLKKKVLRKWSKLRASNACKRRFFKGRLRKVAKKALFGLLICMEQKKRNRVLLAEAEKFRARNLAELVLKTLKGEVEKLATLQAQAFIAISHKNEEVRRAVVKEWCVFAQTRRFFGVAISAYKNYSNITRAKNTLKIMREYTQAVSKIKKARNMMRKCVLKLAFQKLMEHKQIEAFAKKARNMLLTAIIRQWHNCTEKSRSTRHFKSLLNERANENVGKQLRRKALSGLKLSASRNRVDRRKVLLIAGSRSLHITKTCMKVMKEKAMYAMNKLKFINTKRRMAFGRFRDNVMNQRVNKELAFNRLELSLNHYATNLMKKALLGVRSRAGKERLRQKYSAAQRKFATKQYFELWKRAFFEFSANGIRREHSWC